MPQSPTPSWIKLQWDSEFFGFPIGRVSKNPETDEALDHLTRDAEENEIRCLYWLIPGGDTRLLQLAQESGFRFVDLRLDYGLKSPTFQGNPQGIRSAAETDLPKLHQIAAQALTDTRFTKDHRFPAERVSALYGRWIERDFSDNHILVAVDASNRAVGFVTCSSNEQKEGRIGLFAVDGDNAGQGHGSRLLSAAKSWFAEQGCSHIFVATQATNISAQRAYQASGFKTISADLWFHKWF